MVTPDVEFRFRDGGLEDDGVSERVAKELPSALDEGGVATMTASWIQSGDDPVERPALGWKARAATSASSIPPQMTR